jgi:iron-sulfur cluster insertion protein
MSAVAENVQTEMPAPLLFTDSAAAKVADLIAEEGNPDLKLRVFVQGGGCSGFEYALGFDQSAQEGDHQLVSHGIDIVVDPLSAPYLSGTQIDFVDGLQGGFAINNPNVTAACGCGHSFQVEEGAEPDLSAGAGCGSGCSH